MDIPETTIQLNRRPYSKKIQASPHQVLQMIKILQCMDLETYMELSHWWMDQLEFDQAMESSPILKKIAEQNHAVLITRPLDWLEMHDPESTDHFWEYASQTYLMQTIKYS